MIGPGVLREGLSGDPKIYDPDSHLFCFHARSAPTVGPELLSVSWSLLKPLPGGSGDVMKCGRTPLLKTPSPSPPILRWWVMRWRYLCQEAVSLVHPCLVLGSLLLLNLTNRNPNLPVYKSHHRNGRLFIIKNSQALPLYVYTLSEPISKSRSNHTVLQGFYLIL